MSTVTLSEAKTHLNLSAGTNDAELQDFIDRAEAAIERRTGPLVSTTITRRARGGGSAFVLPVYPVISLTSATPDGGTAIDTTLLDATPEGVVTYLSDGTFPTGWHTIVYEAGHALTADDVPEDLKLAVLELTRHLWETQRGGTSSGRPGSAMSDVTANTVPGAAFLFPFRVEQLLAPYMQPGI
jgi:uncharacterized phiE125 gp8 family phage protein